MKEVLIRVRIPKYSLCFSPPFNVCVLLNTKGSKAPYCLAFHQSLASTPRGTPRKCSECLALVSVDTLKAAAELERISDTLGPLQDELGNPTGFED